MHRLELFFILSKNEWANRASKRLQSTRKAFCRRMTQMLAFLITRFFDFPVFIGFAGRIFRSFFCLFFVFCSCRKRKILQIHAEIESIRIGPNQIESNQIKQSKTISHSAQTSPEIVLLKQEEGEGGNNSPIPIHSNLASLTSEKFGFDQAKARKDPLLSP